jgi:hypothetical protein
VTFAAADEEALGEVVTLAWQNIKAELASKSTKRPRTTRRRKKP